VQTKRTAARSEPSQCAEWWLALNMVEKNSCLRTEPDMPTSQKANDMRPESIQTVLDTDRLHLRIAKPSDGRAIYDAVLESLENLRAWPTSLPWATYEPTVAASEQFSRQSEADCAAGIGFAFLAFDADDRLVGSVGLHSIRWDIPSMEIGFWMRSSVQRRGFATEAVEAVLNFSFTQLGARRVQARTDEDNRACRATCEAVGMTLEGTMSNERITPSGIIKNGCLYALIS